MIAICLGLLAAFLLEVPVLLSNLNKVEKSTAEEASRNAPPQNSRELIEQNKGLFVAVLLLDLIFFCVAAFNYPQHARWFAILFGMVLLVVLIVLDHNATMERRSRDSDPLSKFCQRMKLTSRTVLIATLVVQAAVCVAVIASIRHDLESWNVARILVIQLFLVVRLKADLARFVSPIRSRRLWIGRYERWFTLIVITACILLLINYRGVSMDPFLVQFAELLRSPAFIAALEILVLLSIAVIYRQYIAPLTEAEFNSREQTIAPGLIFFALLYFAYDHYYNDPSRIAREVADPTVRYSDRHEIPQTKLILAELVSVTNNFTNPINSNNGPRMARLVGAIEGEESKKVGEMLYARASRWDKLAGAYILALRDAYPEQLDPDSFVASQLSFATNDTDARQAAEFAASIIAAVDRKRGEELFAAATREGHFNSTMCYVLPESSAAVAIPTLLRCLEDCVSDRCATYGRRLLTLCEPQAIAKAIERVGGGKYGSAESAEFLEEATGQKFGEDRDGWDQWWKTAQAEWRIPEKYCGKPAA